MTLSAYTIVLYAHVLAGAFLLGGSMLAPLTRAALRRAANVGEMRTWLAHARASARANPLVAVTLLGTGLYLGSSGTWHAGWFQVAVAAWVVDSILATRVLEATGARMAKALGGYSALDAVPPEADRLRRSRAVGIAADVIAATDLATLFLMLTRPSLVTSLLVVAGTSVLGIAIGALVDRARGSVPARARA